LWASPPPPPPQSALNKGFLRVISSPFAVIFLTGFNPLKSIPPVIRFASFVIPFLLLLLPVFSFSQITFINNGQSITNTNAAFVINGNVIHQNNGSISNTGNFYITGDCINNNTAGNVFTTGTNGWVHLYGATQAISGSTLTHFNNLGLSGTGTKQLNSVNTEIEDTLSLNDREFAAGDNTVFVIATGTGVVRRLTDGFVSSTNDGGLSRNTISTGTYSFPVGSSTGTARFRPVDITPNSIAANTFKVRMANVDAATEGFDRSLKESTIGGINPNFYHRIYQTNGTSPADITLYYDVNTDGDYGIMTQWQNTLQWKNLGFVATTNNYGLSGLTKQSCTDFSAVPFALAEVIPAVFVANGFSPNGDGSNDVLHVCGKGIAEIQFIIYDRWGEKVFETTDINKGWDGTFRGEPMNSAVFVYIVKGKFINGNVIDKKGNVALLR